MSTTPPAHPTPAPDRAGAPDAAAETWHYGLIARWWAEVNTPDYAELDYLRAAITRHGEPALDLGCGTGRLLVPLLADGLDVDGIDISGDMVALARDAGEAAGIDMDGRLGVQAFDALDRGRAYGFVFSIGSFAIGSSPRRDATALRRIHDHLRPGGAVALSYEVLPPEGLARLTDPARVFPEPWSEDAARATLRDGDVLELRGRTTGYDPVTRCQGLAVRATLMRDGGAIAEEEGALTCTYYEPDVLRGMLETAGFVEISVEGPYTGRPPRPDDDTVVMTARRPV